MTPTEEELLTGMGNCFEACHEDFEGTVEMVSGYRHLTPDEVRARLLAIRETSGGDALYQRLRRRLPPEFPC